MVVKYFFMVEQIYVTSVGGVINETRMFFKTSLLEKLEAPLDSSELKGYYTIPTIKLILLQTDKLGITHLFMKNITDMSMSHKK